LKILFSILASCVFIFSPKWQVYAQDTYYMQNDTIYTVYKFEEVVVYGKRYVRPPSMITEIDTTLLKVRNSSSVADILRMDTGIIVSTGTKGETRTSIRGFNSRDILVLVDGYPLNTGYYGKVDLSMIQAENIAKIKIVKGPASTAYGANTMGGVINIITKSVFQKPLIKINTEFGANQFYRINFIHSRSIGRFNYSIFAYRNHSKGFVLSKSFEPTIYEDGEIRDNSNYDKAGIYTKIGLNYSKNITLGLDLGAHWAEKGCPATVSPLELPRYSDFPEWRRFSSSLNGSFRLSPAANLKTVLFVDSQNDRYKSYKTAEMSDDKLIYDSLLENWTTGGSIKLYLNTRNKKQLITGITFRRDLMNKKPDIDKYWYSHHNFTCSVFTEFSALSWKTAAITTGIGFHIFSNDNISDIVSHFSPLLSLSQILPFKFNLTCSWSNAIRFPTMHHLYSTTSGNESLKPEEADKIEVGLERTFFISSFGSSTAEIVWFDNKLKNLIYRESRTYIYQNIKKARLCGFEGRLKWKPSESLSVNIGYAIINGDLSTGELLENVPQKHLSLELYAKSGFGTIFYLSFNTYNDITTYIESVNLPNYCINNISLSQKIMQALSVNLKVNNLFDKNYMEELGYPGTGRQITLGFSWKK